MKKTNKLWLALMLTVLVAALLAVGFTAAAEEPTVVASGTCGNALTWTLDSEGTLTISGEGDMTNFGYGASPWYSRRSAIRTVMIEDGVTSIGTYAFRACSSLTSVTIPDGVTRICDYAFYGCRISSITIPDSVTSIGNWTFEACGLLTSITIPDSVTSIGLDAFHQCTSLANVTIGNSVTTLLWGTFGLCTSLTSITIPDSVTSIGQGVFDSCKALASVTIGNSVQTIGSDAFRNCTALTSVTIPDNVTAVFRETFYGCTALENVTIGNGMTSIGEGAFFGCTALASVTIPDSVTSINSRAFRGCTALESVTLGNGLTTIGKWVFDGCTSLTSITIPDSVTSIQGAAFYHCTALEAFIVGENNAYLSLDDNGFLYNKDQTTLIKVLPNKIGTEYTVSTNVTSIGDYAFEGCQSLTSIAIPDGVTTIGDGAFDSCTALESVTIPDGVTSISDKTFFGCAALESVTIPDGVTSIGEDAFDGCAALESVTIPASVTSIGGGAFSGCAALESVTIPNGVTSICDCTFSDCTALENVTIPNGVTSIGAYTFFGCTSLTNITIPDSVTEICGAFVGCSGLTSIKVPEGVPYFGELTFAYCTSLTSITIPVSVTEIIGRCFRDCDALQDVYYAGSEEQWNQMDIDYDWNNEVLRTATIHYNVADWGYCGGEGDGTNLTWVLDSEGTLTISGSGYARNGAFQGRTDVKNVVFLDGTDYIGGNMFAGCSNLESITIPHSSMEEIEVTAFADCDSLSVIYYDGTPAQWDLMTIYYHAENLGGSYAEYAQTMRAYLKSLVQFADTDWGYCGGEGDGTNLMWELSTDYTLTISGTGEMANYTLYDHRTSAPWGPYYIRLKTVVLQPGVTSIGDAAFNGCIALENVTIPAGVLSIGDSAFRGCFALTSITIPDGVTSIPPSAFATCLALTSVMIPDSVTSIDAGAFSYCTALQDVYYGGSKAQWGEIQIDESGEYGNESLLNANVHYNVTDWGYCGGEGDGTNLTWVLDSDDTLTISGEGAMADYTWDIGAPWRKYARHISSFDIQEGVTTIGDWAFQIIEADIIALPQGVTTIGEGGFCNHIKNVIMPVSVTRMEAYTFTESSVRNIFYAGSEEQWNQISLAEDHGLTDGINIHFNATGHTPGDPVRERIVPATCTEAGGYDEVVYCTQCPAEISRTHITVDPLNHRNAQNAPAVEATATAHGHTAGLYCPDCDTWLSGDVVHNALGAQTVIQAPTETEEGIVDIVCTVCGETFRYTAEKLPHTDPQTEQPEQPSGTGDTGNGFWMRIQTFFKGIIDWFLRLFRFFG